MMPLLTERLILRPWRREDRPAYAAMMGDPTVMRHYPATFTRPEAEAVVDRFEAAYAARRFTFFAVEEQASGRFIGAMGIKPIGPTIPLHPAIEIGWTLVPDRWGQGIATEGARAVLRLGFDVHGLEEIVAYTATTNAPSRRVMDKIGLVRDAAADFVHPSLPAGHRLSRHVVYRLGREAWADAQP